MVVDLSSLSRRLDRALSESFHVDNPGGEWLDSKRRWAEDAIAKGRGTTKNGITGTVTAWFDEIELDVDFLSGLPGHEGEDRRPGDPGFDWLMGEVSRAGWDPDPILVMVNHLGQAWVWEGNTRIAVARSIGQRRIPAEVRYWNGGETADGPCTPELVTAHSG